LGRSAGLRPDPPRRRWDLLSIRRTEISVTDQPDNRINLNYAFQLKPLSKLWEIEGRQCAKGVYLTDTLALIRETGLGIGVFRAEDPEEISGGNTQAQLEEAGTILTRRAECDPAPVPYVR